MLLVIVDIIVMVLLVLLYLSCYLLFGYRYASSHSQRILKETRAGINPERDWEIRAQYQINFRLIQWFWPWYMMARLATESEYDQAVYNSLEEREKQVAEAERELDMALSPPVEQVALRQPSKRLLESLRKGKKW